MTLHKITSSKALFALVTVMLVPVTPAFAHMGHVGDLAGHSHWAGIALVGAAVALAGVRAAIGRNDDDAGQEADASTSQDETGDEAHA